ncbi:hypothetical protein J4526_09685 [Desulfurococcaceae archaeon MEX13E-LK6-19]|nr:hypothetical protein J4526_09685 [Desulfurococcaceae archaeon MEX13E-LK6-19]
MDILKRAYELLIFMNIKYLKELEELKAKEAILTSKKELTPIEEVELIGTRALIDFLSKQLNTKVLDTLELHVMNTEKACI